VTGTPSNFLGTAAGRVVYTYTTPTPGRTATTPGSSDKACCVVVYRFSTERTSDVLYACRARRETSRPRASFIPRGISARRIAAKSPLGCVVQDQLDTNPATRSPSKHLCVCLFIEILHWLFRHDRFLPADSVIRQNPMMSTLSSRNSPSLWVYHAVSANGVPGLDWAIFESNSRGLVTSKSMRRFLSLWSRI